MRTSEITFTIQLDSNNIPDKMTWYASENPEEAPPQEIRSLAVAIWDHTNKGTMKIDLWTKDMEVPDMKRFIIDSIGGLGESLKSSTGDKAMHEEIVALCDKLTEHVKKEEAMK
jgi:gliding motility-associated protein GldC